MTVVESPFRGHRVRTAKLSLRLDTRTLVVTAVLLALILGIGLWSIAAGDYPVSPRAVVATLFGQGLPENDFIVLQLRLPRLLTGILTGIAFGMSGAIFQSLCRNPLASPDVIGFNAGAALGAVAMIILMGASGVAVTLGAVGGGLLAAVIVFALSWQDGVSPLRLVLVGIGVGFTAYAGVDFLMTRSEIFEAASAQLWLTGSLNARTWSDVTTTGLGLLVLTPLAIGQARGLDLLEMGDDLAAGLGGRVNRTRAAMAVIGVLLCALAVAAAGPLAFVAFVAGPIARRMTDRAGVGLVTAGLVGAVVVIAADLAGRLVLAPMQLPAGVFTAVFGAPYLLWLLATQIRKGAL